MKEIENKEIEEMARVISDMENPNAHYYIEENGRTIQLEAFANSIDIAKILVNKGYGKVEDYKKEIERLKEEIKNYQTDIENISMDNTALAAQLSEYVERILEDSLSYVDTDYIKEVAKEFGVQIEE